MYRIETYKDKYGMEDYYVGKVIYGEKVIGRFAYRFGEAIHISLFGLDEKFRKCKLALSVLKSFVKFLKEKYPDSDICMHVKPYNAPMLITAIKAGFRVELPIARDARWLMLMYRGEECLEDNSANYKELADTLDNDPDYQSK